MSSAVRSLEEMLQGWLLSGWSDWGVSPFAVRGVNTGLYLYNLRIVLLRQGDQFKNTLWIFRKINSRITSGSSRRSIEEYFLDCQLSPLQEDSQYLHSQGRHLEEAPSLRCISTVSSSLESFSSASSYIYNTIHILRSDYKIWNNGQILEFKVSKWLTW